MNTSTLRSGTLIPAGLFLGLLGDALLRAPGAPGLNLALWALALAVLAAFFHLRRSDSRQTEAMVLLAIGFLFAAAFAWRDSDALKLLALGASATAFALPALHAGAAWVRRGSVFEYAGAVAAAVANSALGGIPVLLNIEREVPRDGSLRASEGKWRGAGRVLRGVAIALPFLIVIGALFINADDVFAGLVTRVVRVDFERFVSHILLIGFFGWVAMGYLGSVVGEVRLQELGRALPWRPSLGIVETATVLVLLDFLFFVFVVVQLRYLFGGAALVEVTPGLGYAEYARQGFFELVAVSAITVPLMLAAEQLLRRESPRDERVFRVLAGIQVLLLAVVMASAFQRLLLYQTEYGLTEARLYATVLLGWLALMLSWFTGTVLRGRRESFAFGALLTGFGVIAALLVSNPDAMIVRTNLQRASEGADFDAGYVGFLSADAVPTLVAALPMLPDDARCRIAKRMLDRWGPDTRSDWRNWSWSGWRARTIVAGERAGLDAAVGPGGSCPGDEG